MNKIVSMFGFKLFLLLLPVAIGVIAGVAIKHRDWSGTAVGDSAEHDIAPTAANTNEGEWGSYNESNPIYVVETDENNNKTAAGFYQNEKRVGNWELFYPNGEIRSVGKFEDDVKVGVWRNFYPNGNIMSEGRYDDDGQRIGIWTTYYPNGSRKLEGAYSGDTRIGDWLGFPYEDHADAYWYGVFDQSGKRHGEWRWYSGGQLRVLDKFQGGKRVSRDLYNGGFQNLD